MQKLPIELMETLTTNKKLRNQIANAIKQCDKNGHFKFFKTVSYPLSYIVTQEQINTARKAKEEAVNKLLSTKHSSITFIDMGANFINEPGYLNSHRMRCYFTNNVGKHYFLEVGTALNKKEMRIDFAIDMDLKLECETLRNETFAKYLEAKNSLNYAFIRTATKEQISTAKQEIDKALEENRKASGQPYYNFKGLERRTGTPYTEESLLKLINEEFDCSFTSIEIDLYDLSPDETKIINVSDLLIINKNAKTKTNPVVDNKQSQLELF